MKIGISKTKYAISWLLQKKIMEKISREYILKNQSNISNNDKILSYRLWSYLHQTFGKWEYAKPFARDKESKTISKVIRKFVV